MPQTQDTDDIAFTVPVKTDSLNPDGLRTIHVVVTKPMPAHANENVILGPLLFVFFLAALLILMLFKISGNKKFRRISDAAERLAEKNGSRIDNICNEENDAAGYNNLLGRRGPIASID
ncbi:hypothetical protein QWZ08_08910 [Ferruginibacter paludis]|uniref:hypothetical protein n=1 Tax=Ferruginibacter paludis TaxID=1310417 RepID=UPI0025B56914|nr:hypothetical protein [Ferruginibacter paludis]MDN3655741.1 hypothetical protein [Ferruginibacter paludis]